MVVVFLLSTGGGGGGGGGEVDIGQDPPLDIIPPSPGHNSPDILISQQIDHVDRLSIGNGKKKNNIQLVIF